MSRPLAAALLGAALAACIDPNYTVYTAKLSDGTYQVVTLGQPPAVEGMTARLDRAAGRLTFTLADQTVVETTFTPRPSTQWHGDCTTMASHFQDEVADLAPAPLALGPLSFPTPLVFAKCSPDRMILASDLTEQGTLLVLERVATP